MFRKLPQNAARKPPAKPPTLAAPTATNAVSAVASSAARVFGAKKNAMWAPWEAYITASKFPDAVKDALRKAHSGSQSFGDFLQAIGAANRFSETQSHAILFKALGTKMMSDIIVDILSNGKIVKGRKLLSDGDSYDRQMAEDLRVYSGTIAFFSCLFPPGFLIALPYAIAAGYYRMKAAFSSGAKGNLELQRFAERNGVDKFNPVMTELLEAGGLALNRRVLLGGGEDDDLESTLTHVNLVDLQEQDGLAMDFVENGEREQAAMYAKIAGNISDDFVYEPVSADTRVPIGGVFGGAKKPSAKKPAAKKPMAKKPEAKKPAAKKPVAKKSAAKKTA